jgi:hypothetical protein
MREYIGKLVYLASPYTHANPAVREARFVEVVMCRGWLMNNVKDVFFYAPIGDCHSIALRCKLPGDWNFWAALDECIISRCDEVWVLCIEGRKKSKGVNAELAIAARLGLPVKYVIPQGDGSYVVTETEPDDEPDLSVHLPHIPAVTI